MSDTEAGRGAHHQQGVAPPAETATEPEPLVSLHAGLTHDGRREVWLELHSPTKRISPDQVKATASLLIDIAAAASTTSSVEAQLSGQAGAAASMPTQWDRAQARPPSTSRPTGATPPDPRRSTGEAPTS